ncbi:MAG: SDR family oxidoreductase [Ignavibacteria bacterium]|nr:SDR family oxidoreductase [Ignavibacteria bacterium]
MNILLTGISKGLGLSTASLLLQKGHTVFGISRSLTPSLKKLKNDYSNNLNLLHFDLKDSSDVHSKVFKNWIGIDTNIDGFVNNAAIAYDDIVTNLDLDRLESMFRLNVFTPMMLVKYVIRQMLLHNIKGSIVHISSISAHTGYKGLAMYASSKSSLEGFSKNTAREWGEKGIRSNCVVAGFMETDMSSDLTKEQKERIYKRTALKKAVELESVANTIIFLLSEDSKSITGQNIFIDNGTI